MTSTEKVKAFILLSGGIDSTTTLAMARQNHPDAQLECVSIDYGQRHAKEMASASAIAAHFGASHIIIPMKGLMTGMLVDKGEANEEVPNVDYADLPKGISPTYVSYRNGLMLSILAARAQSWVMSEQKAIEDHNKVQEFESDLKDQVEFNAYIYCGVHADDGANWAYPDCTPEFIGSQAAAIFIGTYQRVRLKAPLLEMSKADVVAAGTKLHTPYELTWSCYKGEELHCGICPTCRSRKQAFIQLGLKDPTTYAA